MEVKMRFLALFSSANRSSLSYTFTRFYATPAVPSALKKKKLGGKHGGPMVEKKEIPVETDVNRLVNYVCGSNIYKTGEDIKLKDDSEYPEWLWTLHTGPPKPLEELDPNTKAYWRRVRKLGHRRNNQLASLRKF